MSGHVSAWVANSSPAAAAGGCWSSHPSRPDSEGGGEERGVSDLWGVETGGVNKPSKEQTSLDKKQDVQMCDHYESYVFRIWRTRSCYRDCFS